VSAGVSERERVGQPKSVGAHLNTGEPNWSLSPCNRSMSKAHNNNITDVSIKMHNDRCGSCW